MSAYLGFSDLPAPDQGNLETHEEKSEFLQKGVRFSFFQNKIKQTLFPVGELMVFFKYNFVLVQDPLATRCHFLVL